MGKFICNHTGQILIPCDSLRGIVIEPVSPLVASGLGFAHGAPDIEGFRPVRAKFIGDACSFDEYYVSRDECDAEIYEIASGFDSPIYTAGKDHRKYESLIEEYKRKAEREKETRKSAFHDHLKGEIR